MCFHALKEIPRMRRFANSVPICVALLLFLSLLLSISTAPLLAQEVTASISGTVTDPSGEVIPGASVEVVNPDTGAKSTAVTGSRGEYMLPLLRPGRYQLTISSAGFRTYQRTNITLEVNERANIDVRLEIGQTSERIEVIDQAAPISTESTDVAKVIDNTSILRIPLNGRLNINGLLALAPGIQNAGAQDQVPYYGLAPNAGGAYNYAGVGVSLDGMAHVTLNIERSLTEYPPPDAIQEVKVITSGAGAEFGKPNQIVVVTKGGTNELHGQVLEFNRNRFMAAKNFFATQLAKPAYNRNEFGASLSGPLVIPKLYNGKNKTFFLVDYEGFRLLSASTSSQQVATAAMRQGNFAGLATINDPLSGTPFPGNVIPTARLNTVTQRLGQLYPLPNMPGTGAAGTGVNLTENISTTQAVDRGSVRVDEKLSDSTQLAFSFLTENLGPNPSPGPVSTFGGMAGIGEVMKKPIMSITHTFSPTIISETRLGYQHLRVYRTPQSLNLGTTSIIPGLPFQAIDGAPQISITNIVGMSEAGSSDLDQAVSINQSVTIIKGTHTLKMGGTFLDGTHWNQAAQAPQRGAYNFTGRYSGVAYSDFVLGYPATTQNPSPSSLVTKGVGTRYEAYLQDTWKVSQKLTATLGIRYDLQWLRADAQNYGSLFIPNLGKVAVFAQSMPAAAVPGALNAYPVVLSKSLGLPTNIADYIGQDTNNFAPRIGLAYKLNDKTVLRAAFGLYYNAIPISAPVSINNLPFVVVGTYEQPAGSPPSFTMYNPFPGTGTVPANPSPYGLNRTLNPYSIQYNGTMEREVWKGMGLRASFVAQRNIKQFGTPNINQPMPQPGTVQPLRPYQPFSSINLNNTNMYQNTLNQLQGGAEKRYSNGLLVTAQYSYSRLLGTESYMNPFNWNDSRGNIGGYRRHVLVTSFVYDLPFGSGKWLLHDAKGLANGVISGWQLSGVISGMSGAPFSPSFSTSVVGSVGGRPNVVLGQPLYPANRTLTQYFNPAAFSVPANYTFGNAGYNQLWGPGQQSWDLSLVKNTSIREKLTLQLRIDAFSAFNHPTFGNPASDITNPGAVGRITSAGGNRTVLIGAKLFF
jgi:hypothetical protein